MISHIMKTETQSVAASTSRSPGWYQRLFAWMMAHGNAEYEADMADRKREMFADLHGSVLEIGPGTGPNLTHYPRDIRWIGIEPNPYMHSYLKKEADRLGFQNIDLHTGTAEQLNVVDKSMDAVVSTLVLCSVNNLPAVLEEIKRVLKPGGRFFFLEHVAAPQGTQLRRMQNWIEPLWQVLGDGCHPNRETWLALENAGFERVDYEQFQANLPAIVSPQIMGVATKR